MIAPPPGRLVSTIKMPVQVRMFPEEVATVDAFAAELSQHSYGAAFSRAEALRIAAMEWLKERQARHARVTPASPPRAPAAAPADTEHGPVVPPSVPPAGPQGLRPAEVRQATGVPPGTVASALHGLVQRGHVRTVHDRSVATAQARASEL